MSNEVSIYSRMGKNEYEPKRLPASRGLRINLQLMSHTWTLNPEVNSQIAEGQARSVSLQAGWTLLTIQIWSDVRRNRECFPIKVEGS